MPQIFSPTEIETLYNKKFFFIKASATQKIVQLFSEVKDEIKRIIEKEKIIFPKEVDTQSGKIFRGENYLNLPYIVLDYPKFFSKESVFSFRTMFWWGNFLSFTVHLQGKVLEERRNILLKNIPNMKRKRIYICINNNPWQYHYKKDNYLLIDKLSDSELKKIFLEKEFIKLSRKIQVKNYKNISKFTRESFFLLLPYPLFNRI